ncbi:MAG: LamG-like jellyroll fold domain-containing protein [Verrucomicrobiota bacterium]
MEIVPENPRELIQAYLDRRLSDEEFNILHQRLEEDPEARAMYADMARMDAGLRDLGVAEEPDVVAFPLVEKRSKINWWAVAAVLMAFLLPLTVLFRPSTAESGPTSRLAYVRGVAVITAEAEAVWEQENLSAGATLEPGRVVLSDGLAQIDFFGGASVSLSGPAELELIDGDAAVLHRGTLRADVPPAARGFEVTIGEVLLEDLGTSFGLSVDDETGADLVVFDGEVRTTGVDGKSMLLLTGDTARLESGKTIRQDGKQLGEFPDITDVIAGSGTREESRYSAWKESSLDRRRDPRLIAYFDFEDLTEATRRLRNQALHGAGSELDGGIVGARVAEGRWRQKTALDFRSEGDRVRFDIPGEWEAITLYAWVRIDALDRHLNSLFLTDYFDQNEIHWQLSDDGGMHFASSPMGVEDIPEHNRRFYSEKFWNPSMSGQWFFLAVSAEKGIGNVTSYVNGKPISIIDGTQRHKPLQAMRIGEADLGNWSDPIWDHSIRTLNGRIDEFAIYQVALSAEEIAEIYEAGRP